MVFHVNINSVYLYISMLEIFIEGLKGHIIGTQDMIDGYCVSIYVQSSDLNGQQISVLISNLID